MFHGFLSKLVSTSCRDTSVMNGFLYQVLWHSGSPHPTRPHPTPPFTWMTCWCHSRANPSMRPSPSATFTIPVDTMKYFFIDVSTTDFTEEKKLQLKTSGFFLTLFFVLILFQIKGLKNINWCCASSFFSFSFSCPVVNVNVSLKVPIGFREPLNLLIWVQMGQWWITDLFLLMKKWFIIVQNCILFDDPPHPKSLELVEH